MVVTTFTYLQCPSADWQRRMQSTDISRLRGKPYKFVTCLAKYEYCSRLIRFVCVWGGGFLNQNGNVVVVFLLSRL